MRVMTWGGHAAAQSYNRSMVRSTVDLFYKWVACIGAAITLPFSRLDPDIRDGLYVAFVLVFCDTVTGLSVAIASKQASSRNFRVGLFFKLLQFSTIFTIGWALAQTLGNPGPLRTAVAAITLCELWSNVENLYTMEKYGVKLPKVVKDLVSGIVRAAGSQIRDADHAVMTAKKEN